MLVVCLIYSVSELGSSLVVDLWAAFSFVVSDLDVLFWRENFVTVVVGIVFGDLAVQEFEIKLVEDGEKVPFRLQDSVAFAGTEGAESHDGVLQLLTIFVKPGVDESVVLEVLQI